MKPLRAPWQVWAVVALAPVLWFLYQQPGDPFFDDTTRAAAGVILASALLLWGWKWAWVISAAYTGAFVVIFIYQLFEPSSEPSSEAVRVALALVTAGQFALLVSPAAMGWVGIRDRRTTAPPVEPTT